MPATSPEAGGIRATPRPPGGSLLASWQEVLRIAGQALLRVALLAVLARDLSAQEPEQHHPVAVAANAPWTWTMDGHVFLAVNAQDRKFTDFTVLESQNWFMLAGERQYGSNRLKVEGMASLEPFTIEKLGSPQLFQTGEAFHGAPLIDRQHPHDLLMNLGASYRMERGGFAYTLNAALVGSAAMGPAAFMHRASGRDNPQAPLTHHYLDSTHITPGVVGIGVERHNVSVEASWFRGEEPNDNRLNIDRPRFDSWSTRLRWRRGPWDAQFSGGHLRQPHSFDLYDLTRLTASIAFTGSVGTHPLAAMIAWGENREVHGILDGYLAEWRLTTTARGALYGRAEAVAKDLLDLGGPAPRGFIEFHRISHVRALTIGYLHDVVDRRWGRAGLGADLTLYRVPENMLDPYGESPRSFHVFFRWRPTSASMAHVH